MTATALATRAPGVYEDVPEADYHSDTVALSQSGAKKLLPPSCPARFRWDQLHGTAPRAVFDFGHAAHAEVLGKGLPVRVIPDEVAAKNGAWTTTEAKLMVAEARAAGETPLKPADWQVVQDMAAALRRDPLAAAVLGAGTGRPEVSLYAEDLRSGVLLRGRLDHLRDPEPSGRVIVADYKTADSASPEAFARAVANYGYFLQAPWYQDLVRACGIADDVAFLFVVQEKAAPYITQVYELDPEAVRFGRRRNREAIDLYGQCVADDDWPTYDQDIVELSLPGWFARQQEDM